MVEQAQKEGSSACRRARVGGIGDYGGWSGMWLVIWGRGEVHERAHGGWYCWRGRVPRFSLNGETSDEYGVFGPPESSCLALPLNRLDPPMPLMLLLSLSSLLLHVSRPRIPSLTPTSRGQAPGCQGQGR